MESEGKTRVHLRIIVAHKRDYQVLVMCISSELTKTREAE